MTIDSFSKVAWRASAVALVLGLTACQNDLIAPEVGGRSAALAVTASGLDLGTLGGDGSYAHAVNSSGVVAGEAQTIPGNPWPHAFVWTTGGGMRDLGTLPTSFGTASSRAADINDAGLVVGQSSADNGARAFIWSAADGMRALPAAPGGFGDAAVAINASGVIAGSTQMTGHHSLVVWDASLNPTVIGRFGDDYHTIPYDMNASGDVVGFSQGQPPMYSPRMWIWSRAAGFRQIDAPPGGVAGAANGINDQGQVVGWVGYGGTVPFLWTETGGMTILGRLADTYACLAEDINNAGVVTGRCFGPSGPRAFIWTEGEGMVDVGPGMGEALNEAGLLAGNSQANVARVWNYTITPDPVTPDGLYSFINDKLVRVDPSSGAVTTVMTAPRNPVCCVAADERSNSIYATHSDPRFPRQLLRLRPGSGTASIVGALSQNIAGMVVHPTRGLLGVDHSGSLFTIDRQSGAAQFLGSIAPATAGTTVQDLAVTADGALYGIRLDMGDATRGIPSRGTTLIRIDLSPLHVTDVANFGTNVFLTGLAANGSSLIAAECGTLLFIDPATAAVTSRKTVQSGANCLNDLTTYGSLVPADDTPPSIAPGVSGTRGDGGWYTSDVTVTWSVSDPESTISSSTGCNQSVISSDVASITLTCSATSAGGTSSSNVEIRRDATPPAIAFPAHPGTYQVNEIVEISCTASDATSGVATSSCDTPLSATAWSLGSGVHTYAASARDHAGNTTEAATSFTVAVTYDGVCALTRSFSSSADVASGLCDKLAAAKAAAARGNEKAAANILGAFTNQLSAQTGKAITAEEARVLGTLIEEL